MPASALSILLLIGSNIFMTIAWYGHLKVKHAPMITIILVSWGIAFFEYCLQVPANRIGYGAFSVAQLKGIQEIISLTIFTIFSIVYLKEAVHWNHLIGFGFIIIGAFFLFYQKA